MDTLKQEISHLLKGIPFKEKAGINNELHIQLNEQDFPSATNLLSDSGLILISAFCTQAPKGFTLRYAFEKRGNATILIVERHVEHSTTSIATLFPSACWYEREIRDGFGVEFTDAFDKRRLFLHETYPKDFHPLLKSFKNHTMELKTVIETYPFKEVKGEGVYQIPVGPVHAGIIEPGHFRFSVIGETIFNLEVRMFYKHRGIEKLAEGKNPQSAVAIAEAISGDETVANSVAYCNAAEKIASCEIPARASHLRTILLEIERIYSHLGDLAGMIIDVAYPAGASPFFMLREEIFRLNEQLTGSRFMKNIVSIGGLKRDIPEANSAGTLLFWNGFMQRFNKAVKGIRAFPSVIDRLETTGVIKKELIAPLNLTGPTARASGTAIDTRTDHPYCAYGKLLCKIRLAEKGDVLSRFELKAAEINDSINIIQTLSKNLPKGQVSAACKITDGCALSLVEAPRGQNLHWLSIKDGVIERYKIRTASFCNWQAIEHAVTGNIVPDFPLINKSLNLSYAGTDL